MRAFRVVYGFLVLNFLLPAISYAVAPGIAEEQFAQWNRMLGGGDYSPPRHELWHMLGTTNVVALAFMCALLWWDVRRFYPVLPALLVLKGASSLYSLVLAVALDLPAFYAVCVLDGVTTAAMWFFARRAHRAAR